MPAKNSLKEEAPNSYYHVYARGINRSEIFHEDADYTYFIKLFERYLSKKKLSSPTGAPYPSFHSKIRLTAYCLMPNHFHLYIHQNDIGDMASFMRSLMTSYSKYFNKKYKRSGSLFESRYKAVRTTHEIYHQHITRYIHLNPRYWKRYPYSSLQYFAADSPPDWLSVNTILRELNGYADYYAFLADYVEARDMRAELKHELADQ